MSSTKEIARTISILENQATGYEDILLSLDSSTSQSKLIGITGAPGAGKSTLTDCLIEQIVADNKKVAILCIDPSSPFNMGALLGDRIRMNQWYTHPNVFIRSMASRKALGGLSPMIIEVTGYLKTTGFDYIIIETVGVGQNEIDIAGLADVTVVVLVPESGDEIQTMKSGIMEIGDILVVNKSDRPDADIFVKHLHSMLAPVYKTDRVIPVLKTVAATKAGILELYRAIQTAVDADITSERKLWLYTEKTWQLIQQQRMKDISRADLFLRIKNMLDSKQGLNIFRLAKEY